MCRFADDQQCGNLSDDYTSTGNTKGISLMAFTLKQFVLLVVLVMGSTMTNTDPGETKPKGHQQEKILLLLAGKISGIPLDIGRTDAQSFWHALHAPGFPEGSVYARAAAYLWWCRQQNER